MPTWPFEISCGCWLLALALAACRPAAPPAGSSATDHAAPRQLDNGSYQLRAGPLTAVVSPDTGGRVTSLRYGGRELLAPRTVDTLTFGATFWISPQDWPWPPPAPMDRRPFRAEVRNDTLWLDGPDAPTWGWHVRKALVARPADTTLHLHYWLTNRTDTLRRAAPWVVVRLRKGGRAYFPVVGQAPHFDGGVVSQQAEGQYEVRVPAGYRGRAQKISADGADGWVAYDRNGLTLTTYAPNVTADRFAPRAGDVEIYVDDDTDYVEMEQQGAYEALPPGGTLHYATWWRVRPSPAP